MSSVINTNLKRHGVCLLPYKTPEPQDLHKIQLHIRTRHGQMSNISYQYLRKNDSNIIPNIYMLQHC